MTDRENFYCGDARFVVIDYDADIDYEGLAPTDKLWIKRGRHLELLLYTEGCVFNEEEARDLLKFLKIHFEEKEDA